MRTAGKAIVVGLLMAASGGLMLAVGLHLGAKQVPVASSATRPVPAAYCTPDDKCFSTAEFCEKVARGIDPNGECHGVTEAWSIKAEVGPANRAVGEHVEFFYSTMAGCIRSEKQMFAQRGGYSDIGPCLQVPQGPSSSSEK